MGKKSKTTVNTDPAVGRAAREQAEIGRELAQLGRDEFEHYKAEAQRFNPLYEKLINTAIGESDTNAERAAEQWQQYKDVFQPLESRMAEEAANYDSAGEIARREGLAAATVARQFDNSEAQMQRNMARMGVAPTSSMGAQAMRDAANARALGSAGAINKERNDTKLLGMSLRQDAARFGRNQTGTGLAASAAALQGAQGAGGLMGGQMQTNMAAGQQAAGIMGAGAGQIGASGNMLLNQWNTQQRLENQSSGGGLGLGSLVGSLGSAAILKWSSEKLKEDIRPADDEQALGELEQVAVKDWKYKDGIGDGGAHTGPIAEDMQAVMGNEVAPEGAALDMVSVSGKHHAAIRALSKRDKKLAQRVALLEKRLGDDPVPVWQGEDDARAGKTRLPAALQGDLSPGIVGLPSLADALLPAQQTSEPTLQ